MHFPQRTTSNLAACEVYDSVKSVTSLVQKAVTEHSNFARYEREIKMKKLCWGFIHSEKSLRVLAAYLSGSPHCCFFNSRLRLCNSSLSRQRAPYPEPPCELR